MEELGELKGEFLIEVFEVFGVRVRGGERVG